MYFLDSLFLLIFLHCLIAIGCFISFFIHSAILLANNGGTAFPTCLCMESILPVNSKSSGNVCIVAHSLIDSLRFAVGCISEPVAIIVSFILFQLFILKLVSYVIFFSSYVKTSLSNLSSKPRSFFSFFQSDRFGMLPELLSFLNQCPAVYLYPR